MDDKWLYRTARGIALSLPEAQPYVFAEDWEAARVCGKWFMLASDHGGMLVNLKAAPGDVRALVESFNCIEPGYHMNKRHWISVRAKDGLDEDLLRSLVINSYLLVRSGLPKASRPHLSDD
ncbi:MmcQ/YjbR family DNA-binding protein [Olsenella urininfantis]|uniref:MmcQ/YjbR family DNA-binding protein n=1 Tax=Olsenella urininfantis TaxID=1871033 RepID=UPI0009876E27|nr:MmcQ/YjbR family DNA-binding protein [Olsenella urininfantis]